MIHDKQFGKSIFRTLMIDLIDKIEFPLSASFVNYQEVLLEVKRLNKEKFQKICRFGTYNCK